MKDYMANYLKKLFTLVRKEALMIIKDKLGRIILIGPIIVQTLVFGYVASYDLNKVDYALLDEDNSFASRELAAGFDGSAIFTRVATMHNSSQMSAVLDEKRALLIIHIGPHFAKNLNNGRPAPVQVLINGRNSNVAATALGYAQSIINDFTKNFQKNKGLSAGQLNLRTRAWFNPNLETRWNIISGMIAILAIIQVMVLAGQSVAREREQGTFDQLLVTPLSPFTIMLGKALPPVLVGLLQSSLVLLIALFWFNIPLAGSCMLLYLGLFIFNLAVMGVGLCISALVNTMQQAMLFSFSLLMPMILLSGFVTPISSMPPALQIATLLNPARYGVEFSQRIYLEGAGLSEMITLYAPLLLIGLITLGATSFLFRKRLA